VEVRRAVSGFAIAVIGLVLNAAVAQPQDDKARQDIAKQVLAAFAQDHSHVRWYVYAQQVCTDETYRRSIVAWAGTAGRVDAETASSLEARILRYLDCVPSAAAPQPSPTPRVSDQSPAPQKVTDNQGVAFKPTATPPPAPLDSSVSYAKVNRNNVNVRVGPGMEYAPFDKNFTLKEGATVKVLKETSNGWQEIEAPGSDGKTVHGFVKSALLTFSSDENPNSSDEKSTSSPPLAVSTPSVETPSSNVPNGISVTVKCAYAVGYVAPDGDEWDGATTIDLSAGNVVSDAVEKIYAKTGERAYKGKIGLQTVIIRQSDIDGANCYASKETAGQPQSPAVGQVSNQQVNQCTRGAVPGLFGVCICPPETILTPDGWCRPRFAGYYGGFGPPPPRNCSPLVGGLVVVCN
jgi:hypothetical protein